MLLEKIGLIGWQKNEALILSSMIARLPILMVGNPGTGKTYAAQRLSEAVLTKCRFSCYEVPNISYDDLIGFPE
jgi:MoxR-like ATPase